ncbi:MAG TPA: hypothetical protein PKC30_11915 [Saprospiraceae bacterium]|nr:hypothetical protein [Saprospiraceae bacterium]
MNNSNESPEYRRIFGLDFPIYKNSLIRYTIYIYLGLIFLLTFSVLVFDYEMTNADIPGGLISGFLLAYLMTILKD